MKRQSFIIGLLFLLILLFACQNKTLLYPKQIVGEWESVNQNKIVSYHFEGNEVCRKMPGFFEYIDPTMPTVENPFSSADRNKPDILAVLKNIIRFYRSHSCYKIENDCLKIFDPALKTWDIQYIDFNTADTLILTNKDKTRKDIYARKQLLGKAYEPLFEQILFYYPETDFTAQRNYSIHRNGTLLTYGENGYITNFISATVEKQQFDQLETLFRQANIEYYLDTLSGIVVDTISPVKPYIVFIRENKKYVFNSDFSLIRPSDLTNFYQAYFSLLFHIQETDFQPRMDYHREEFLYYYENMHVWEHNLGKSDIKLSEFDMFYLVSLINNAAESSETFLPVYTIKGTYKYQNIITDGRFFTYGFSRSHGGRTVDIGFNFLNTDGFNQSNQ